MSWLPDGVVDHLRVVADLPDLSSTRYRLVRKVAQGGMGTVYEARDSLLDRPVAVKVLSVPDMSGELAARMLREARVVARLEHPGIVPVHDVGTLEDGRVFYAMKLVQGKRLDQYAKASSSISDLLRVFQKVCETVAFAHAHGVIHRDLKPENIMVGAFGEILVMDWGLAKILDADIRNTENASGEGCLDKSLERASSSSSSHETLHGSIMGTPSYMAPEQESKNQPYWIQIMVPGTIVGLILGFATQKYGKPAGPVAAR